MKKLSLIAVALLLSACGGSSHDNGPVLPLPTPAPVLDAFYIRINALIGSAPEDTEPQDVSAVSVTEPEATEPVGG
ncbi:hypothetical protein [Massilia sp. CF038]|uniref:hypothetical protein n=1 Tax=Massilia sp. CF038 TaxID=1881045 RepID=UPI0009165162|nr:hypothetical protein [Massilia sp. CF038]SHG38935.1 hypothetical protein SAMN05428948_0213 [Massilia sp. CF038]